MRQLRPVFLLLSVLVILIHPAGNAVAQDKTTVSTSTRTETQGVVDLKAPSWQQVLDKLFGTPNNGLLDMKKTFEFSAENVNLTAAQSAAFFTSSSAASLASLIEASQALHGQVKIEGKIDGKPFDLRLAGRELKLDGLTLTAAQRESLSTELRGISGLHESKINAIVDGKATMIVIAGGKERISLVRGDRPDNGRVEGKQKVDLPQKVEVEHRAQIDRPADRPAPVETHDRVEPLGRVGGVVERPEIPRVGK